MKETGARAGEVWALKWIDVNPEENTLTINNPEKGSRARKLKVSTRLISLLSTLTTQEQFVFKKPPEASIESLRDYFIREKRKIATKSARAYLLSHTLSGRHRQSHR